MSANDSVSATAAAASASDATEASDVPGGGHRKSRLGLIYFALAAFDVLAVCAGLILSHQIMSIYMHSVTLNQEWATRLRDVFQLNELAQVVNAPGNDVFDSKDHVSEQRRLTAGLHDYARHMRTLRQEFKSETDPSFIEALDRIDHAMNEMVKEADLIFGFFAASDQAKAIERMATMDRKYADLTREVGRANSLIQHKQAELFTGQVAEAHSVSRYEYLIGALIMVMVGGVMFYGHHINRLMTKTDAETRDYARRLRLANAAAARLNAELADSLKRLEAAQEENLRRGKLAQLGQLTATMAHEIRNPLGAVKAAAFLIERKARDKGLGLEQQMQRVSNGIQRCDKIITELLDFTRTKTLAATSQPLDEWLQAVVEEERRAIPAEVAVEFDLQAGSEPLSFDTSRMRRVIINLLSNAAEAMVGSPGQPGEATTLAPRISISSRLAGDNVELIVADNGPGISPEVLARIREPLFTTKSFGVGLGIPAVENVLEQHGGGLRIESVLGAGTTATAWFPKVVPAAAASEPVQLRVA